jgi:hypothetical protein
MNLSSDISGRSSLNFERPNTPNTSTSLSLPSISANHARLANSSVERPVPPYSQTDNRPAFDFHAYLRDIDPGTIYVVEELRFNPSQLITRARKHGIDHLQRWYQTQRLVQPDPFHGHRSLIIKHCPCLTSCHPGTSHALQVKLYEDNVAFIKTPLIPFVPVQSSVSGAFRSVSTRPTRCWSQAMDSQR